MLGADVIVVEHPGLFLGQDDDAAGAVSKSLKHGQQTLLALSFLTSTVREPEPGCSPVRHREKLGARKRVLPGPQRERKAHYFFFAAR
ncbi:hypothetical protein GCM10028800_21840 [Nesterenkonia populi]